ncbi:hypothetical protein, partial [Methyloceanibacter sp.]|uniref:hypothetical protein n=1 Tax=Methyloceanibacter sp. TaxID=1965321 RepID=UPI002D6FFD9A
IYMWSTQEDGTHPPEVGLNRLTLYCMGQDRPEIVGFGSSIGFDTAYCDRHPGIKLCEHLPKE